MAALALASAVPAASADSADLATRLDQPLAPGRSVPDVAPRQDRGAYVAKLLERTPVRNAPGGDRRVWTADTTSLHTGNATRLTIMRAQFDAAGQPWLEVQLPVRPNGTTGWIPADQAEIRRTPWFVRVRLRTRQVTVYRDGRLQRRSRAVIGASATPTPRGTFAIYEIAKQRGPNDFLGPWALHLTSFSDVLKNYGGGPGRAAIHGRGPTSIREAALGSARSHGCIRVPNALISWMSTRTLAGTPFRITDR